jgi:hypothetical protein
MTDFVTLSSLVVELRKRRDLIEAAQRATEPRMQAATLAVSYWGMELVQKVQPLVNVAALTLGIGPQLVVHQLNRSAIEIVDATDVHALPPQPPRLLRGPWIVESAHPDQYRLYGDTVSVAGYELDGAWYLVHLCYPDDCYVCQWRPQWGAEISEVVDPREQPLVRDLDDWNERNHGAVRLATTLGLLLDAVGTPLHHRDHGQGPAKQAKTRRPGRGWTVRHVSLHPSERQGPVGTGGGNVPVTGGRIGVDTAVTGHLKLQRCGPEGSERKLIYVSGYMARRWVAPFRNDRVS